MQDKGAGVTYPRQCRGRVPAGTANLSSAPKMQAPLLGHVVG